MVEKQEVMGVAPSSRGRSAALRAEPATQSQAKPAGANAEDFNAVWDNAPASPVRSKPVEVHVVARRCVYVNNYRVAGGKPYFSENLPSHTLNTTLGECLDAFSDKDIRAALREKKTRAAYFAAYHERRKAAALPSPPESGQ